MLFPKSHLHIFSVLVAWYARILQVAMHSDLKQLNRRELRWTSFVFPHHCSTKKSMPMPHFAPSLNWVVRDGLRFLLMATVLYSCFADSQFVVIQWNWVVIDSGDQRCSKISAHRRDHEQHQATKTVNIHEPLDSAGVCIMIYYDLLLQTKWPYQIVLAGNWANSTRTDIRAIADNDRSRLVGNDSGVLRPHFFHPGLDWWRDGGKEVPGLTMSWQWDVGTWHTFTSFDHLIRAPSCLLRSGMCNFSFYVFRWFQTYMF